MSPASALRCTRAGRQRRRLCAGLALLVLAGCAAPPLATQFESYISFDRTFNTALGAMADQKMVFSVLDRRQGLIVGQLNGDTVKAELEPQYEGTTLVSFSAQGAKHADGKLLARVIESFRERTAGQAHILPPGWL